MTAFLRLLEDQDKEAALLEVARAFRNAPDVKEARIYDVNPLDFLNIPGAPFAYWTSAELMDVFGKGFRPLEAEGRDVQSGATTGDDFRFLRLDWEIHPDQKAHSRQETLQDKKWVVIPKGGSYSTFYSEWPLVVNWKNDGAEVKAFVSEYRGRRGWGYNWTAALNGHSQYFRPGITWPRRTTSGLSLRVMPPGCIFADKGPAIFCPKDNADELLAILAITSSKPFALLVDLKLAAADAAARSYEVGIVETTPVPHVGDKDRKLLGDLSRRAWELKCRLNSLEETSKFFVLPAALRNRPRAFDHQAIQTELDQIQSEIDQTAFRLYGFSPGECSALGSEVVLVNSISSELDSDTESEGPADVTSSLLSWCVGVAFGRFDWRSAVGESNPPPEPTPFAPLPVRSPGMVQPGGQPFHVHSGILVDEPGHTHDISHLVEEVIERIGVPIPTDVRRWLRREFFAFHLRCYSGSRRKAPIYWPLSTASGNYTLWIYYPRLSSQTLFTAMNDFVEPKLKQVGRQLADLRDKGPTRSRTEETQFEHVQEFELELIGMREALLKIAQNYYPNQDDGVQITAAPLWHLFRHKPWQKLLKETWAALEQGEFDWASLAMGYWPNRVREKCKTDKSLAIAHGLEALYQEPKEKKGRGRK